MNDHQLGVKYFRRRLAFGIRDTVLGQINSPQSISNMTGVPLLELGILATMTDEERQTIAVVVARALDQGIQHFLYGLDNQADGFEIKYNGVLLNDEGMYYLTSQDLPPIADESLFDRDGKPRD